VPSRTILVDAHVHGHACYEPGAFFDHAAANFEAAAGHRGEAAGCLMLTESAGARFFDALLERAGSAGPDGWSVGLTGEAESLLVSRSSRPTLFVVCGRQVVTRERLEVLALGTQADFVDGLPISEALGLVSAAGAIPVIPWGLGKWWAARGRCVAELLERPGVPRFFLGDNGGRPRIAPAPRLFRRAAERGIAVLPGSDPLPFPGQVGKVAGYGFVLSGEFASERPAASVKRMLAGLTQSPAPFGRRESVAGFVRAQLGMQWRVRRGIR
jgi:hypothetical protein